MRYTMRRVLEEVAYLREREEVGSGGRDGRNGS